MFIGAARPRLLTRLILCGIRISCDVQITLCCIYSLYCIFDFLHGLNFVLQLAYFANDCFYTVQPIVDVYVKDVRLNFIEKAYQDDGHLSTRPGIITSKVFSILLIAASAALTGRSCPSCQGPSCRSRTDTARKHPGQKQAKQQQPPPRERRPHSMCRSTTSTAGGASCPRAKHGPGGKYCQGLEARG